MMPNLDNNILSQLNQTQQEAVTFSPGPLLILAGPGSGKTRTLIHRAAWLILKKNVSPENLLLLTFTNKAAEEMRERLKKILGENKKQLPWAGTFHSFCARVLRIDGHFLNIPKNFTIYDDRDQEDTIKKVLAKLDLSPKQYKTSSVLATISQAKNEMITALEYPQYARGTWQETVARIYLKYQQFLKEYQALDFDDLLLETARLFQKEKNVLNKYQDQYHWVLIDEYQDTNHAQYLLTKLLVKKHQNLNVVGDASQCLPSGTAISTPKGKKKIETLKTGNQVIAASGRGKTNIFTIKKIYKRQFKEKLTCITTKSGKKIRLTPNHILFAALKPTKNIYLVYLMYRRDKGYRIGITKGLRTGDSRQGRKPYVGLNARGNQEAADKMWILKTCPEKQKAVFWELYYSYKYGLPTLVFDTCGRDMKITQKQIDNLFSSINTTKRAEKLIRDFHLNLDFPHHRPKGISGYKQPDRQIIHLKFFEDPRQSIKSPWGAHRISLNTSDQSLERKIKQHGFYTRPGKKNTWRTEIMRLKYSDAQKTAQDLSKAAGDIDISCEAFLGKKRKFFFHPASHIQPKMIIATENNGIIKEETVSKVKWENYNGFVWDLDVNQVHNYLANDIVVHNSIYGWRGADYRNLVNLKDDFPQLKVINLEQNYRSTQSILDAANNVIKKNTTHPVLNLWTVKKGGEKISLYEAQNEQEEAQFIVEIIKNHLISSPDLSLKRFAVLYRTNAQSRIIEETLLHSGLPYLLVGGVRFYERKEIKDCLAYLRVIANPQDKISLQRTEKLGKNRLKKFQELVKKNEASRHTSRVAVSSPPSRSEILPKSRLSGTKEDKQKVISTLEWLNQILAKTEYLQIYDENDPQDLARVENVKELRSVATEFPDLNQFLENVALIQQEYLPTGKINPQKDNNVITLMTAHAAKGTEFPIVFIIGLEEGLFPHARALMEKNEVEEERRLCYVAMTRAQEKLYLSYTKRRFCFESPKKKPNRFHFGEKSNNQVSRFINDIPTHLLDMVKFKQ